MAARWVFVVGAVVLAVAVVLFGIGIYTVYGIARDPSARLKGFKEQLNITTTGPNVSFSWTSQGYNVTFSDTSTDNTSYITSWIWDFGDGTGYRGANPPPHAYSSTCPMCTETVTLVVGDAAGNHSTANASVVIQKFGGSSGVSQSSTPKISEPKLATIASEAFAPIELLAFMFLIAGAVAVAGRRLLQREPETIQVPVRPRGSSE